MLLEASISPEQSQDHQADQEIPCRCGLCCVVYTIPELNKVAGYPCPHLEMVKEQSRCADYGLRPKRCVAFDCRGRYPKMQKLLDETLLDVLSGIDLWSGAVRRLHAMGMLSHSPTVQAFSQGNEPSPILIPALKSLVWPLRSLSNDRLLQIIGVDQFLDNLSPEGTRKLLVWSQSLLASIGETMPSKDQLWHNTVALITRNMNADLAAGVEGYKQRTDLSEYENWALSSHGGSVPIQRPDNDLVFLLERRLTGRT